jgi:phosphate transport system protein
MREGYHQELDALLDRMVELTRIVETMTGRATTALLDADLPLAENVISLEGSVQVLYHDLDDRALRLLALQRYPQPAVPPQLRATILAMGQVAQRIIAKAGSAIASKEAEYALELEQDDDEMDRLHDVLYRHLHNGTYQPDAQTTMDITLIGRYYERFADHAVSVARRVAFLAGKSALDYSPALEGH